MLYVICNVMYITDSVVVVLTLECQHKYCYIPFLRSHLVIKERMRPIGDFSLLSVDTVDCATVSVSDL